MRLISIAAIGILNGLAGGVAVAGLTAFWISSHPPKMLGGGNANVKWMFSDLEQRMEAMKKTQSDASIQCNAALASLQQTTTRLTETLSAQSSNQPTVAMQKTLLITSGATDAANQTQAVGINDGTQDENGNDEPIFDVDPGDTLDLHDIKLLKIEHGVAQMTIDGTPVKITRGVGILGIEVDDVDEKAGTVKVGGRTFHTETKK